MHRESDILDILGEQEGEDGKIVLDRSDVVLLDSEGRNITEEVRIPDDSVGHWSSSTAKVELFMVYVFIGILLVLGIVFARYFLNER